MKLYRIHVKQENGCYSPGFYHEDRAFLLSMLEQAEQNYGPADFWMEEVDLAVERLDRPQKVVDIQTEEVQYEHKS